MQENGETHTLARPNVCAFVPMRCLFWYIYWEPSSITQVLNHNLYGPLLQIGKQLKGKNYGL